MKESYKCELPTHFGPESCGAARKGSAEALTEDIQPRKNLRPGTRPHRYTDIARCTRVPRGQRSRART